MVAKERILLYATGATVASAIGVLVASNYGLLLTLIGKDSTLTGRTDIWKSVLASAMKHPVLGYGYSAFLLSTESSNVTMALRHATNAIDNGYLVVWLELGAVGLSLFGYTLIRVLKDAVFCLNSSANPYVAFYVLVVLLTAIGNVTEAYIMSSNRLVWIMYVMACVVLNSEAKRIRRQGLA
jgi:O-antigen ligase